MHILILLPTLMHTLRILSHLSTLPMLSLAMPCLALGLAVREPQTSLPRRAALAHGLAVGSAVLAAPPARAVKFTRTDNKCSFEETEKLMFSEVGWGDADIKVLSQALSQTDSSKSKLKKLFLNGNKIGDEGAAALTGVLKAGSLPKIKIINLAGNKKMSEGAKATLRASREGLEVN